jgi:hypothetical protein
MKFGLYLKNKGVITAETLVAALEFQQNQMPPVGQLAMEEGILSARQIFKVLRCQSSIPHERFGEVAVGMGMMTPADLQRLLMIQWERKPPLADVLVKLRILSQARVDEELIAYREAMERRNVVIKRFIPTGPHLDDEAESTVLSDAETVAMMF